MSVALKTPLQPVVDDLQRIFGNRLIAVMAYGWRPRNRMPSLALVHALIFEELTACAARTAHWHRAGCETPLVLTQHEFVRSLDAFPIEYDEILSTGQLVAGTDPFAGLSIARDDLRRACEVQAKSHLVHLREDYLESAARPAAVASLVRDSAPAFVALLRHLARLDLVSLATPGELVAYASQRLGLDARLVGDIQALTDPDGMTTVDAGRIFSAYLAAVERLAEFVDKWRSA